MLGIVPRCFEGCWEVGGENVVGATGKMWLPAIGRWLLPSEKMLTFGYPVTPETAKAAMVQQFEVPANVASALGNAMNLAQVGVMELVILASTKPTH